MRLIDGQMIAASLRQEVTGIADRLRAGGTTPTLAVVVPTDDEASAWYVRSIQHAATRVGIECVVDQLHNPSAAMLTKRLDALSVDPAVHGIICQTPLPNGLSFDEITMHIDPVKDIDGANPTNLGRLVSGQTTHPPSTAAAVLELLHREQVHVPGSRAVVVGRSITGGKPVALLLLAEHATVTICHSQTVDLQAVCAEADILVVAIGYPQMIDASYLKSGATVIIVDIGTDPVHDGAATIGDSRLAELDGAITPASDCVGSVATMMLMKHTAHAAAEQEPRGSFVTPRPWTQRLRPRQRQKSRHREPAPVL
jgi:methylenetetrahydrofolate dehydrogenase (NADP+) / methenyltetrahydrofolate cyclohydrolase